VLNAHALALAYALSTVAGLRASLTVLALSIAVHQHVIIVPAAMGWLASDATLVVAGVFALADACADKVPVVDSVLHLVHVVLSPFAGGIAAFALVPDVTAVPGGAPAIVLPIAGAAIAFVVNGLRGTIRAATSALSFGVLNPVVSIVEDVGAVAALILAFIAPLVAAAAVFILTGMAVVTGVKMMRAAARRRAAPV
jgi:hypothetical protein